MNLPEHHELIFGTTFDNVNLYYQVVEVALAGDTDRMKVILTVTLKSESKVFGLYRLFTFPMEITNDTYVEFKPTYTFLVYNQIYQSYSVLTEEEVNLCVGHKIVVFPVRRAIVYVTDVITCESSLFFQKPEARRLCPRQVTWNPSTPIWKRHETTWLYHMPAPQPDTFECVEHRGGTPGKRYGAQCFVMLPGESTVPHSRAACWNHRGRRQRRGDVHPRTTGNGGGARNERLEGNCTGPDQTVGPPSLAAPHPTLYG